MSIHNKYARFGNSRVRSMQRGDLKKKEPKDPNMDIRNAEKPSTPDPGHPYYKYPSEEIPCKVCPLSKIQAKREYKKLLAQAAHRRLQDGIGTQWDKQILKISRRLHNRSVKIYRSHAMTVHRARIGH